MVADMGVGKVADMVADMAADKKNGRHVDNCSNMPMFCLKKILSLGWSESRNFWKR